MSRTHHKPDRDSIANLRHLGAWLWQRGQMNLKPTPLIISAYAIKWHDQAEVDTPGGVKVEQITRGAFDKSIRLATEGKHNIRLLLIHDTRDIIAQTADGSLEIHTNAIGMRYIAEIRNRTDARYVRAMIRAGELRQSSVGFDFVNTERFRHSQYVDEGELKEISLCRTGAYRNTEITIIQDLVI